MILQLLALCENLQLRSTELERLRVLPNPDCSQGGLPGGGGGGEEGRGRERGKGEEKEEVGGEEEVLKCDPKVVNWKLEQSVLTREAVFGK